MTLPVNVWRLTYACVGAMPSQALNLIFLIVQKGCLEVSS